MGFLKDVWDEAGKDAVIATYEGVTLRKTRIVKGGESHPLEDVTVTIESGSALDKRLTATRVVLTGPFALLLKKSKGGESFLTIEGPDFVWPLKVGRKTKDQQKAREFAAKVQTAVKQAAAMTS